MLGKKDKLVVIGDLHFPYVDKKALAWTYKMLKKIQPTIVLQIGDLYDFFYFSKYTKKMLPFTAKEELQLGLECACNMWEKIQAIVPDAKCYQLLGNHDERPFKRILEKVPELEIMFCLSDMFMFPGVNTQENPKDGVVLKIGKHKMLCHHGYLTGLGRHMKHHDMNCIVGHTHKGGVIYAAKGYKTIWELNVGFLGDQSAGPMQYGSYTNHYWTLGLGVVDEDGPRFISYK